VLRFRAEEQLPQAIKVVGNWYKMSSVPRRIQNRQTGPWLHSEDANGARRPAVLVGPPPGYGYDDYVLVVTCDQIPPFTVDGRDCQLFLGGFDENAGDPTKDSTLLVAQYPDNNYKENLANLGSIDLNLLTK
jgi:hypothetical protein